MAYLKTNYLNNIISYIKSSCASFVQEDFLNYRCKMLKYRI